MRRRDVLLGGVAALATTAARAQCVTNGFDIRGCAGVVSTGPAPSLDLNLLAGPLDGRITFTRASTGTYFDAAGVLQTAATNAPRFDADPVTHAARGLLIEEARTNICTNSQAINSWTKTDSTVTDNSTTSPDGTSNASLITEGTAGNALVAGSLAAVAASSVVSFSMFFKRGNNDWVRMLGADTGTANGINVWINLSTGAFSFTARGTATGQSASVTILANGWYRLLATCTLIGTSNAAQLNTSSAVSNGSASKVNNATYYSWGGQVELGAFPTSYIPTTAAAATRAADVPTMPTAGIVTAGTAGTLVGDAQITAPPRQLLAMSRSWTTERPTTVSRCVSLVHRLVSGDWSSAVVRHSSMRRPSSAHPNDAIQVWHRLDCRTADHRSQRCIRRIRQWRTKPDSSDNAKDRRERS